MLSNLASTCAICIVLAIAGWRKPTDLESDSSEGLVYSSTDYSFQNSDLWGWSLDETPPEGVTDCCSDWSVSLCWGCPGPIRYCVVAIIKKLFIDSIHWLQTLRVGGDMSVSNTTMIVLSLLSQLLIFLAHRLSQYTGRSRVTSAICHSGSSVTWLTDDIKQTKRVNEQCEQHGYEMEIMAQTIEYLQKAENKNNEVLEMRVLKVAYPPMIGVECLDIEAPLPVCSDVSVTEPEPVTPSSSEDDLDPRVLPGDTEFIEPELEWDSEFDVG